MDVAPLVVTDFEIMANRYSRSGRIFRDDIYYSLLFILERILHS